MIEYLIAVLLTMSIIANCYIGSVCKKLEDRSKFTDNESTLIQKKMSSPQRNVASNVSDRKKSSLNSDETKRMKQIVQQTEPGTVSVNLPLDRRRKCSRSSIWSDRLRNQLDSITNSTSEVCKNIKIIETQAEIHATKCTSTNDFAESHHDNDNSSRRNYLIHKKTKNSKLKDFMMIGTRTFQSVYSRRKNLKANESSQRKNQTLNVPVQNSSCISPISRSATRIYNLSTSSKISTNGTRLRPTNNEIIANNDNKMEEDIVSRKPLRNDSSDKLNCDLTIRNEPSSTMNQTRSLNLDESKRVSIQTTNEDIVISIKFSGRENNVTMSQTNDSSFCECPLVKSFNNFLGMFKDCFDKLYGSHTSIKASKDFTPLIRVTDHSRTLNNSRNETSYMKLPKDVNRSVGNK